MADANIWIDLTARANHRALFQEYIGVENSISPHVDVRSNKCRIWVHDGDTFQHQLLELAFPHDPLQTCQIYSVVLLPKNSDESSPDNGTSLAYCSLSANPRNQSDNILSANYAKRVARSTSHKSAISKQ